ncbi:MAG: metallophosphoesterase [Sulfurospirillum sp.]|nr:metallophosphoesterase [Sulfurospirillum sp.]
MFRYLFALIASLVLIGINVHVYRRFLSKLAPFSKYKKITALIVIALSVGEIAFFATLRHGGIDGRLYYFFSSLVGVSFMLFSIAILYDILHIPLKKIPFDASRRVMLKMILDVGMLILVVGYMLSGFVNGFKDPRITKVRIKINGLKKPLKIVQISDIHIGKSLGKAFMDVIVASINTLQADIVVITGDLLDLKVDQIGDKLDSLKDIKSKYGVFFIHGNHEYFYGATQIGHFLRSLHVKVLENESYSIDGLINIVGVTDPMGRRMDTMPPDLQKAMLHVNKDLPTILLAHQPKIIKEITDEPIDLILSGHTHAGQIFPFGLLVMLDQPYLYGLHQHNKKTQIFVSSGTGYWGPPIRVMVPSEIVSLEVF